jgi:hypothetical protein
MWAYRNLCGTTLGQLKAQCPLTAPLNFTNITFGQTLPTEFTNYQAVPYGVTASQNPDAMLTCYVVCITSYPRPPCARRFQALSWATLSSIWKCQSTLHHFIFQAPQLRCRRIVDHLTGSLTYWCYFQAHRAMNRWLGGFANCRSNFNVIFWCMSLTWKTIQLTTLPITWFGLV